MNTSNRESIERCVMKTRRAQAISLLFGLAVLAVIAGALWLYAHFKQETATSTPPGDPVKNASAGAPTSSAQASQATPVQAYEMITLLPPDAIPAIDRPEFYTVAKADSEYAPDELVLGVSIDGESRAYSTNLLDHHEIVNDTVGGRKIAVTW